MIRFAFTVACALMPAAAAAASLPITGTYCNETGRSIGPDGYSINKHICKVDDASRAPRFHLDCGDGTTFYALVVEDAAKGTLTFTAEQATDWTTTQPIVLHRCK